MSDELRWQEGPRPDDRVRPGTSPRALLTTRETAPTAPEQPGGDPPIGLALRRPLGWEEQDAGAPLAEFTAEIAAHVEEGIIALDCEERVTFMNRAAVRLLGWHEQQLLGWPLRPLIDVSQIAGGQTPGSWSLLRDVAVSGRSLHVADAEFMRSDGSALAVAFSASPLLRGGRIHGAVVSFHDISRQKAQAAALERRALHDALTDLPNRVLLHDRLDQALLAARRMRRAVALLIFDLDGFKALNDAHGHSAGDALLRQIGPRVRRVLRTSDTVARLGGDEFAVVLPGADGAGAVRAAQHVLAALQPSFEIDGQHQLVGVSLGIAIAPLHGHDADMLLRHADAAMYVAKRGGGGLALYMPS